MSVIPGPDIDIGFTGNIYYVHSGVTGSDGTSLPTNVYGLDTAIPGLNQSDLNDGLAPSRPFATLAKLQSVIVAGDLAYIAGRFYDSNAGTGGYLFSKTAVGNIGLVQWPGQAPAQLKGSVLAGTGWTSAVGAGGATYWQKNVGAGLTMSNVAMDLDLAANWSSDRASKCWLKNATQAHVKDDAADTYGAWNYTDPTLTVRMPSSIATTPNAPAANGVEYVLSARSILGILSSDTTTPNEAVLIDGLYLGPICSNGTSPQGCAIVLQNGKNTSIGRNCITNYGIHGVSIGKLVVNVQLNSNWITGGGQDFGAISCVVWNATGAGNSSTGSSVRDKFFTHPLLATNGLPVLAVTPSVRFTEAHGATTFIRVIDAQAKEYVPPSGAMAVSYGFDMRDTATTVTNSLDPTTYPVQYIQTDKDILLVENGSYIFPDTFNSCVSYTNCRFKYNKSDVTSYPFVYDYRVLTGFQGFFGCEFVVTLKLNHCTTIFAGGLSTATSYVHVNCSITDIGAADGSNRYIYRYSHDVAVPSSLTVDAYGNIFAFKDNTNGARQICVDDVDTNTGHNFVGNEYHKVGTNTYSDNTTFNTLAELDATGINNATNPFADPTGATGLKLSQEERRRKLKQTVHVARGFNQKTYAGNYGGWQDKSSSLLLLS